MLSRCSIARHRTVSARQPTLLVYEVNKSIHTGGPIPIICHHLMFIVWCRAIGLRDYG